MHVYKILWLQKLYQKENTFTRNNGIQKMMEREDGIKMYSKK